MQQIPAHRPSQTDKPTNQGFPFQLNSNLARFNEVKQEIQNILKEWEGREQGGSEGEEREEKGAGGRWDEWCPCPLPPDHSHQRAVGWAWKRRQETVGCLESLEAVYLVG